MKSLYITLVTKWIFNEYLINIPHSTIVQHFKSLERYSPKHPSPQFCCWFKKNDPNLEIQQKDDCIPFQSHIGVLLNKPTWRSIFALGKGNCVWFVIVSIRAWIWQNYILTCTRWISYKLFLSSRDANNLCPGGNITPKV